jgi:hypothetical protein
VGLCDDRRIKPDLVAPGTDILSARSSTVPAHTFWGLDAANPHYAFLGGPAWRRRWFRVVLRLCVNITGRSAATCQALRCSRPRFSTARGRSTAADALADHGHPPDYHQGFGFLQHAWVLPNPGRCF